MTSKHREKSQFYMFFFPSFKFFNPFPFEWVLSALIDFTLSNARRFYSSTGNLLDGKRVNNVKHYVPIKQRLVKLQQTNFCVKRDKICLRQNIGFILDSHACTKKQQIVTSVLVSTPWTSRRHHYFHWSYHHHLVVCFGYLLSVVVIHFFRYQPHFKSQTTRTTEKLANSENW